MNWPQAKRGQRPNPGRQLTPAREAIGERPWMAARQKQTAEIHLDLGSEAVRRLGVRTENDPSYERGEMPVRLIDEIGVAQELLQPSERVLLCHLGVRWLRVPRSLDGLQIREPLRHGLHLRLELLGLRPERVEDVVPAALEVAQLLFQALGLELAEGRGLGHPNTLVTSPARLKSGLL